MEGADAYKLFLGPTIPTLLTTRCEDGTINVGPCSWIQKVSYEPKVISLSQKPDNDTLRNLKEGRQVFGVSVPPIGFANDLVLCGQKPPYGDSELELEGVRFKTRVFENIQDEPVILEPCVQFAICRATAFVDVGDHVLVIATVHHVEVDDESRLMGKTPMYWNRTEFARLGDPFKVEGY